MKKSYTKYILGLLLFGSNGIVASNIALSSYQIVLLRTMIGSIFLLALFFLTKQKVSFYRHKKDVLFLMISGAALGVGWLFLYEAYIQVGVSIASLLYYCGPVIVIVLSPILFQEKLTLPKTVGFIVVIFGVLLVNGQSDGGINVWGLFCGGMSAVMYAVMVISNKKAKAITGMENSLLQLVSSFLAVAIFVGLKSGYAIPVAQSDVMWILILGVLNTGIGCYLYFSSIGDLPVQTVAICGYLEPLSAVLFSVVVLGEVLALPQAIGAICILGGAAVGECVKVPDRHVQVLYPRRKRMPLLLHQNRK